jgi:hypothetical protein
MSQTRSEKLFEQYCDSNRVKWSRIKVGQSQTPDYEIQRSGVTAVVEVKELTSNDDDKALFKELDDEGSAAGWSDAAKRIRNKIGAAVGQLKAHSQSDRPAVLLLFANGIFHGISGNDIRDAMYGDEVVSIEMKPDSTPGRMSVRLGNGACCQPKKNTSLSAIAVMYPVDGTSSQLDVFHNTYARLPLSDWAQDDGEIVKTSDLVLLWSPEDRNWQPKLDGIKPDPLAGRTPRKDIFPIKRLNTSREQMDSVFEDVRDSRLVLTRIAEADIECKLNEYHAGRVAHLTKFVAERLVRHLPFAFWWLEQNGQNCDLRRKGCEFWSQDRTHRVSLGKPRLGEMKGYFAEHPSIVRQCLIPYFKRGGPNELLVFERGRAFSAANIDDTDD